MIKIIRHGSTQSKTCNEILEEKIIEESKKGHKFGEALYKWYKTNPEKSLEILDEDTIQQINSLDYILNIFNSYSIYYLIPCSI